MAMVDGKRLTRQDWVEAGLSAMLEAGPAAVAIEPLAVALGATKGSGYWHFQGRAALLAEVMAAWRDVATTKVIERVEARAHTPREKLHQLLIESAPTERTASSELLVMGSHNPDVRAAVEQVTRERIDYVAALIEQGGLTTDSARTRAVLVYQTYLGGVCLMVAAPASQAEASQRELLQTMLDLALRPVGSVDDQANRKT